MKSRGAVLTECGAPLELMELEIPKLQEGQVLVQMKYSGICRTQLNEIKGLKGPDRFLPHTLGHEGSGVVVDTGLGVTKVKIDDPVILTWIKGDGIDAKGTVYQCGDLKVNSGPISTFLEYAVIAENRLIPIPTDIPLREASLFGCAIPTGAGIIYNELTLTPDSTIALFGLGGIGLSALVAATAKKAKKIIAIDLEPSKLTLAKELGATHTLLYNPDELLSSLDSITDGKGVDFAVEAVGKKEVMELAFKAVGALVPIDKDKYYAYLRKIMKSKKNANSEKLIFLESYGLLAREYDFEQINNLEKYMIEKHGLFWKEIFDYYEKIVEEMHLVMYPKPKISDTNNFRKQNSMKAKSKLKKGADSEEIE